MRLLYGSGSALCFLAIKISSSLVQCALYNNPMVFIAVSSYSPVRLMYEKENNQSDELTLRLMLRKTR